jgi:hypothetical protein
MLLIPPLLTYRSAEYEVARLAEGNNRSQNFTMTNMRIVNEGFMWYSGSNSPVWILKLTGHVFRMNSTEFDVNEIVYINMYTGKCAGP